MPSDDDANSMDNFNPDEEFANREWYKSNFSWFNPHAPNAKFRIEFAKGASKIGVSPDLMYSVFNATRRGSSQLQRRFKQFRKAFIPRSY